MNDQLINKLLNNDSIWALVLVIFLLTIVKVYADLIKPWLTNRIEAQKEIEQNKKLKEHETKLRNQEVEKYNLEETRWNKVFDILDKVTLTLNNLTICINNFVQNNTNELNYIFAEKVIRMSFENSAMRLQLLLFKIINQNHRLDKLRQSHIKSTIITFLKINEQAINENLRDVRYNGIDLSLYFKTISLEHREDFIQLITSVLFDTESDNKQLMTDLSDIINNHYKVHISESLDYINNKYE